jgi:hypothetical protein
MQRNCEPLRRPARARALEKLALGLLVAALLIAPTSALAGNKTLRWTHPDPASVDGFRVHQSISGGAYDSGVDVFKPAPDANGIYLATVQVPDGVQVDLRMTAYSYTSGLSSALSANANSLFLLGAPGQPMVVLP